MAKVNNISKRKQEFLKSNSRDSTPKRSVKPKISKQDREMMKEEFTELINQPVSIKEDELEKYFTEANNSDNPAKELFEVKGDIRTRTELSKVQIACISKLDFVSEELNFPELKKFTNDFMHLMVSHDRKSRKEFVETVKGEREHQQGNGFFNRLGGVFNRGQ